MKRKLLYRAGVLEDVGLPVYEFLIGGENTDILKLMKSGVYIIQGVSDESCQTT